MNYMIMLERRIAKLERACYELENLATRKSSYNEATLIGQFESEYIRSEIEKTLTDCTVLTDDSRTGLSVVSIAISNTKKSAAYRILAKDSEKFGALFCKDNKNKDSIGDFDSLDDCIESICNHFKTKVK